MMIIGGSIFIIIIRNIIVGVLVIHMNLVYVVSALCILVLALADWETTIALSLRQPQPFFCPELAGFGRIPAL
jgi:hypothetical protein